MRGAIAVPTPWERGNSPRAGTLGQAYLRGCPASFPHSRAGRLVAPSKHFHGALFVPFEAGPRRIAGASATAWIELLQATQERTEQPLEVPSDHRGGSRGRPRHHRSEP